MHCPYLIHIDNSCDAVGPRYKPSEFEVDQCCATEQHLRCPLYRGQVLNATSMFLKPSAMPEAKMIKIQ